MKHSNSVALSHINPQSAAEFDLSRVIKDSQLISGELHFTSILNILLKTVMAYANSQRGFFLTKKQGKLWFEAQSFLDPHNRISFHLMQEEMLFDSTLAVLPVSLIRDAFLTKKLIVLNNINRRTTYAKDTYILLQKPESIFCNPILLDGEIFGILYLENSKNSKAFTERITKQLIILCEQATIAFKNSRLFSNLQQKTVESMYELNELKKQIQSIDLTKTQFLLNMNHVIRVPLNTIVGFSQFLHKKSKLLSLPTDFQHYLANIQASGNNLAELIENILDYSKVDREKTGHNVDKINIRSLVQDVFHLYRPQAREKELKFTYVLGDHLPDYILSHRSRINQILMNLISNAIKFTPRGKAVKVEADFVDKQLRFMVKDEGIGIPLQRQNQVFFAFELPNDGHTHKIGKSSLGLAIAKKAVDALNGSIHLDSQEGKGSIFTVSIPSSCLPAEKSKTVETSPAEICFYPDTRVLVVENDLRNQELLESSLRELGLEIWTSSNGKEGLQKIRELKPDLVLLDMHLPDLDGMEVIGQLRQEPEISQVPIIVTTTDEFSRIESDSAETGVVEYLIKPLDINKLIKIIINLLPHKYSRKSQSALGTQQSEFNSKNHLLEHQNEIPLPDDLSKQLLNDFRLLLQIPIFKGGTVRRLVRKMLQVCEGFSTRYPVILKQIEKSVFEGNDQQYRNLVKEALNKNH